MVKQIILPLVAVMVFIALVGFYYKKSTNLSLPSPTSQASVGVTKKTLMIGDRIIPVEIVSTPELRARGLSGRTSLDQNSGMLFTFEAQNVTPSFWMKDMKIPIDIIWINDAKIVKIDKDIKPPSEGTIDSKLQVYNPGEPIDFVLEVNAGYSVDNDMRVGDSINLSGTF
ncbi:MAG: hypothetical protein UT17_C0002G0003 [Candidatus Woesebacteria bacterium GW2011_GWB1_39_10]|uniref:DUF192 domain-containing protein n=2 Tax=Candidatus Woeseibacteriota TaxID=1752722 RepID=A0A0G0X7M2_9BACT|nr:MAG: hypothetical protein UT17_C0002G0003 [Candidatus Woesebacteria bacterium GW2011_GWB1_39_10]KKR92645.1 MAG: hypothetical protein UU42_C0001G0249 [Candidatus Woesebacteria bacterium GW2011_GWA1_41_13b]